MKTNFPLPIPFVEYIPLSILWDADMKMKWSEKTEIAYRVITVELALKLQGL